MIVIDIRHCFLVQSVRTNSADSLDKKWNKQMELQMNAPIDPVNLNAVAQEMK